MTRFRAAVVFALGLATQAGGSAGAGEPPSRTAGGLTMHPGLLPAATIRGHSPDHPESATPDGVPRGRNAWHVVAAIVDAGTGVRIVEAEVKAQVAAPGLAATTRRPEPMAVAGAATRGNYFAMSGAGPFRSVLTIAAPGLRDPVRPEFTHVQPAR